MNSLSYIAAKRVLEECGTRDTIELPLETIVFSKGILIKEEAIDGAEGRIMMSGNSAIITVNSNIQMLEKKRFVIAHELGHYELHRNRQKLFSDNEENLNSWYNSTYAQEEIEANEFASELLMPTELFKKECLKMCRDRIKVKQDGIDIPKIIDHVSKRFQVSAMTALLKFSSAGIHPVMLVYSKNNIIQWFKTSDEFPHYLIGTKIPVRSESAAYEAFTENKVFMDLDRKQHIPKSAWFRIYRDDQDDEFFEYCIHAKNYGYTLSMIWER